MTKLAISKQIPRRNLTEHRYKVTLILHEPEIELKESHKIDKIK